MFLKTIFGVCLIQILRHFLFYDNSILNIQAQQVSGSHENCSYEEEEIPLYLVNGTALLSELSAINTHVHQLLYFLNDSQRTEESYGMKVAHVVGEMMGLHDDLANLNFNETNMRQNLNMTESEVDKAKNLYYNSINYIYNFNKLVGG